MPVEETLTTLGPTTTRQPFGRSTGLPASDARSAEIGTIAPGIRRDRARAQGNHRDHGLRAR